EAFRFLDYYFNNGDGQQHVATPHPVNYFIWGGGAAVYYSSPNSEGLQSAITVPNASFEAAPVPAGTATVAPAGTSWTFTGNAGVYRAAVHPPATSSQTLGTVTNTLTNDQALGYRFTVGASNLVVYALGRWVVAGNGGTHTLHLFSAAGSEIASADLDTSTPAAGKYAYVHLPFPITLQARAPYYLPRD